MMKLLCLLMLAECICLSFSSDNSIDPLIRNAARGNAAAQYVLDAMYAEGMGVQQDYAEAVKWYRKAADQGFYKGQANLGLAYANDQGVPQGIITAYLWFEIAASDGFEEAAEMREKLEMEMTPDDIKEAKERMKICLDSDYEQCN